MLRRLDIETLLVMSKPGERTLVDETDLKVRDVRAVADFSYGDADIGAAIASGNTDGLPSRAADVCLKERRRVVLMFRETPLHAGHIRAMAQATENGAIVFRPVPAFYDRPASLDEMVNHTVRRALDLYDLDAGLVRRWSGKPDVAGRSEIPAKENV